MPSTYTNYEPVESSPQFHITIPTDILTPYLYLSAIGALTPSGILTKF